MNRINITKQVIESLCKQSPEFSLFFDHHFTIETEQSLVPKISRGRPSFLEETVIVPKKKTYEEKLRYYQEDINLANKKYRYYPDKVIIIKGEPV